MNAKPVATLLPHAENTHSSSCCDSQHFVQFYENDNCLIDSLAGFIGAGLRAGEVTIVIATHAHRAALEARLSNEGIQIAEAIKQGRYLPLDAAATLDQFMVDGLPDQAQFKEVV